MLKKIAIALSASAFALTLYAAPAAACPNMDKTVVSKKKKDTKDTKDTRKVEKKKDKKDDKKKTPTKKNVS